MSTRQRDRSRPPAGAPRRAVPRRSAPGRVVASTVEPRLVERRRAVLEARRRSRRRRWIALAATLALVGAAAGVAASPLADLDRVVVTGTDRPPDEVAGLGGLATGDPLALVDLAAARRRLGAEVWVAGASVRREWPDTVRIHVEEEVPVAVVRADGGASVVAASGRLTGSPAGTSGELPVVEVERPVTLRAGADVDADVHRAVLVLGRLPTGLRAEVDTVRLAADDTLEFVLADGAVVDFGALSEESAKVVALRTVLDRVARECMERVDVTVPTRVVVSRADGCEPPAPTTGPSEGTVPGGPADADADAASGPSGTGGDR